MTGYVYDASGTRISKGSISVWSCDPSSNGYQATSDYILGPGGEQLTEMGINAAGGGSKSLVWAHTNVFAAGKLLATHDNDGLHFHLTDPLGTRRVNTDYAGVVDQTCSTFPFGDTGNCATQGPTEHLYTGKERDAESGNDYFGARYYASSMGRFMSPDPSGLYFADPTNPQSFNHYSYVQNNPLVNVDPDGLDCIYTSNLTSTSVSVETVRGDCRSENDNGVFVDGTVNTDSYKASVGNDGDVHLSFGVSSDDTGSGSESNGGFTLQCSGAGLIDVGKAVDPNTEISPWAMSFIQQTNTDSQHKIGCIAQAYGFGSVGAGAGGTGSLLSNLSQPIAKSKAAGALGGSTGVTSAAAAMARDSFLSKFPSFGLRSPVGTPFAGNFAMRTSPNLGVAAGRFAPYAGVALKGAGIAATAYSAYQLANCY